MLQRMNGISYRPQPWRNRTEGSGSSGVRCGHPETRTPAHWLGCFVGQELRDQTAAVAWNPGSVDDYVNFMAWCFPEEMTERLCAEVEIQIKGGDNALSGPERERLIGQLTAHRYRLEADEESLIEMAATQGFAIARRMAASPSIVLGVRILKAAEMVAA